LAFFFIFFNKNTLKRIVLAIFFIFFNKICQNYWFQRFFNQNIKFRIRFDSIWVWFEFESNFMDSDLNLNQNSKFRFDSQFKNYQIKSNQTQIKSESIWFNRIICKILIIKLKELKKISYCMIYIIVQLDIILIPNH
jgi:hypothetical protein